jgi:hypothetical protein
MTPIRIKEQPRRPQDGTPLYDLMQDGPIPWGIGDNDVSAPEITLCNEGCVMAGEWPHASVKS